MKEIIDKLDQMRNVFYDYVHICHTNVVELKEQNKELQVKVQKLKNENNALLQRVKVIEDFLFSHDVHANEQAEVIMDYKKQMQVDEDGFVAPAALHKKKKKETF